ncbi:isochorismatase family protein [Streptomyces sp. NPDC014735]|uniref:isochorismatase family protein n=1 Tax=unclassified Streptomyces TaxID=2593676 RepID=UPI0036F5C457
MTSALVILVGADVIRPSPAWLFTGGKKRKVARNMIWSRDTASFDRVDRFCRQDPGITDNAREHIVFRLAVITAAKGGTMADITVGDLLESLDVEYSLRGERRLGSAAFRVLRELGVFGPGVPTLREITSNGQLAVEELVDRYPIACRPVRDLLVDYLGGAGGGSRRARRPSSPRPSGGGPAVWRKLIFAGVSLEVCAALPAISATAAGHDAYVAVDASGTFSRAKREAGLLRMQQAGVILSDYATLMVETLADNAAPESGALYAALDTSNLPVLPFRRQASFMSLSSG